MSVENHRGAARISLSRSLEGLFETGVHRVRLSVYDQVVVEMNSAFNLVDAWRPEL
jgi:hypothetical protein